MLSVAMYVLSKTIKICCMVDIFRIDCFDFRDCPLRILCPNSLCGRIIGKKGNVIKSFMEKSGTNIVVSRYVFRVIYSIFYDSAGTGESKHNVRY